ncbi:GntR family transcriptional regulator [Bryobacterales bacterium F-183]|nr:GntR family transcriptional regulator [Bryobacterales bacterium F-183]
MTKLSPITRERANEAVHAALRQAILTNTLRQGERLNIAELADQLRVSLTPVRNAVQLLAAEGLIDVRPRSGTFVATITTDDVVETFQIRSALEVLAAELACAMISTQQIDDMRQCLRALARPVRTVADRQQHERDNAELHMVMVVASRNARLLEAYNRLNAHIQIARVHAEDAEWRDRLRDERLEHDEIVDALEARHAERAVRAVRVHLDRACHALTRGIDSRLVS